MSRWLAPLMGVVGLLALVGGMVWAEVDRTTMGGVGVVWAGAFLVVVAGGVAAVSELSARRHPLHHR